MIINQINFRASLLALMFILFILNSSILNAQSGSSVVKGLVPNKNSDPEVGVMVIVRNTKTILLLVQVQIVGAISPFPGYHLS